MSDARKAAEEALEFIRGPVTWEEAEDALVKALRALLAAEPGAKPTPKDCPDCGGYGYTVERVGVARDGSPIPEQRKCDACDGTGEAPAPPAASEAKWLRVYPHCAGPSGAITIEDVVAGKCYDAVWDPSPARDEVREAACAAAMGGLRLTPDEIRKAIREVAPYGPRDRCEAYVLAAAEKAAEALSALSAPKAGV